MRRWSAVVVAVCVIALVAVGLLVTARHLLAEYQREQAIAAQRERKSEALRARIEQQLERGRALKEEARKLREEQQKLEEELDRIKKGLPLDEPPF